MFPVHKIIPTWAFLLLCGIGVAWVVNPFWWQSISHEKNKQEAIRLHWKSVRLLRENRLAEALPTAQRALALREKALGRERPGAARALKNLGRVYWA